MGSILEVTCLPPCEVIEYIYTVLWCSGNTVGFEPIIRSSNLFRTTLTNYQQYKTNNMKNSKIFKLFFTIMYNALTNNGIEEESMCGRDFRFRINTTDGNFLSFWFVGCRGHFINKEHPKYTRVNFSEIHKLQNVECYYSKPAQVLEVLGNNEELTQDYNTPIDQVYKFMNTLDIDWRTELFGMMAGDIFISHDFEQYCSIKGMKQAKIELKKLQDLLAD